jgi:hypothetical protein
MNSVNWASSVEVNQFTIIILKSGTLSFKVIVDHASYVNGFSGAKGSVVDDLRCIVLCWLC